MQDPPGAIRLSPLWYALGLCILLLAACGDAEPEVDQARGEMDLLTGAAGVELVSGELLMGTPASQPMMGTGWHLADRYADMPQWLWASEREAELRIGLPSSQGTALEIEVGIGSYLPYLAHVEVVLNGKEMGRFDLDGESRQVVVDLEQGDLQAGLNSLVLRSSHLESPASFDAGSDARKLGVRVRSVKVLGASERHGRLALARIPKGGQLQMTVEAGGRVVVQDADSLFGIHAITSAGEHQIGLEEETGRNVFVTSWGPVTSLSLSGQWRLNNIVMIICDTLRADALSEAVTPNLYALANEGVNFTRAFSHAPMTLPSHTALFSSRYPHVSGVVNNGQSVPQDLPLLADWMKSSGYETRAVASLGTLWNGRAGDSLDRGFQTFEHARDFDSSGEESMVLLDSAVSDLNADSPFFLLAHFADPHEPYRDSTATENLGVLTLDGVPLSEFNPRDGPYLEHTVELSAGAHQLVIECPGVELDLRSVIIRRSGSWQQLALEYVEAGLFINANRIVVDVSVEQAQAFDIEVWLSDVMDDREVKSRYRQEVARADVAIGQLIDRLKSRGLWDSSLVVFTSDHGEALRERGWVGHVEALYDDLLHVPLMIKLPAGPEWASSAELLGSQSGQLVSQIDLAPTVLDLLRLEPMPGQMGHSLTEEHGRVLVAETHAPEAKLDSYCYRDHEFKLIYTPELDRFELFKLVTDPAERYDVFAKHGGKRAEWQEGLRELARSWKASDGGEMAPAEFERLRALGYFQSD